MDRSINRPQCRTKYSPKICIATQICGFSVAQLYKLCWMNIPSLLNEALFVNSILFKKVLLFKIRCIKFLENVFLTIRSPPTRCLWGCSYQNNKVAPPTCPGWRPWGDLQNVTYLRSKIKNTRWPQQNKYNLQDSTGEKAFLDKSHIITTYSCRCSNHIV